MLFVPRPGSDILLARSPIIAFQVRSVAGKIEEEARSRIHSVTGDTAGSGRTTIIPDGARVVFGFAARYLEFGAYGRSYPFLRPAADAVVPGGRRSS